MRALMVVAVVVMGCGPFAPNVVGRTCDAGVMVQHCANPKTYAACEGAIWREYPCSSACVEGGVCDLGESRVADSCPPAWEGRGVCRAPQVAIHCVDGGWVPRTCRDCPAAAQGMCTACACATGASLAGRACGPSDDTGICEVDGKVTVCDRGIWQQYPCNACRAGKPLTNCNATTRLCSCD